MKTTHQVANFPGFVEPIPGYQLAGAMRKQAEWYGARFELAADITSWFANAEYTRFPAWIVTCQ